MERTRGRRVYQVVSWRRFMLSVVLPTAWCVLVGWAWARSYRTMDEWSMATDAGEARAVCAYQGAVHVVRSGRRAASRPISHGAYDVRAGATWGNLYPWAAVQWRFAGLHKISTAAGGRPAYPLVAAAATYRPTPWLQIAPVDAWAVSFGWVGAPAAGPVVLAGCRAGRRRWRRRRGRCAGCGYDLRGTPGKCPECGAASLTAHRFAMEGIFSAGRTAVSRTW